MQSLYLHSLFSLYPARTRPKIECFPSRNCVGASVMKNCEPFVSGPEFAIEMICGGAADSASMYGALGLKPFLFSAMDSG